jgi:hypothetical protein
MKGACHVAEDNLPEIRINLEEIRERLEHLEAQIEKLQEHNKALENELACTPGQAALLKAIWRLYDLASYLDSWPILTKETAAAQDKLNTALAETWQVLGMGNLSDYGPTDKDEEAA